MTPTLGEFFDPKGEWRISERCRPHWSQAGAVVFITFRTHDSIPRQVLERWEEEKRQWLRARGHTAEKRWTDLLSKLTAAEREGFLKTFNRHREMALDSCHGMCLLKRSELAKVVADSLLHFDGDRYRMGDFVVMPNHVHLLAAFPTAEAMQQQCSSWMHFTAVQINKALGRKGTLWQREPFDHLVRSPEQYEYLRRYIADNPSKAGLSPGEYLHRVYSG